MSCEKGIINWQKVSTNLVNHIEMYFNLLNVTVNPRNRLFPGLIFTTVVILNATVLQYHYSLIKCKNIVANLTALSNNLQYFQIVQRLNKIQYFQPILANISNIGKSIR